MKNFLIKTLVKALQKKTNAKSERFLIVSTTGLGDTLWATPAIKTLREKYPKGHISVLTSHLGKAVLETNPYIDAFYVVGRSFASLLKHYFSLKNQNYHTIYVFHTSQRAILPFCALLGAEVIVGTDGIQKGLDSLLTKILPQKYQHEVERRLEIADCQNKNPQLEFFIDQKAQNDVNSFLKNYKGQFMGIHPGAKDKFKQWDPLCFIKVGNMLQKNLGCQIFITGNKEEEELCSSIASQIPGAISVAGKFNLQQSAALISKFSAMLANDTGPMHLAFALNTPTVALFTPTDPKLCGPLPGTKAIVIEKKKTCAPCIRKKCLEPFCLLQISPGEVYNAIVGLL